MILKSQQPFITLIDRRQDHTTLSALLFNQLHRGEKRRIHTFLKGIYANKSVTIITTTIITTTTTTNIKIDENRVGFGRQTQAKYAAEGNIK